MRCRRPRSAAPPAAAASLTGYRSARTRPRPGGRGRTRRRRQADPHLFLCSPLRPDLLAKLRVVAGDVCEPDCGLSKEDLAAVRSRSRFVIHCAASISFFDHVHALLTQNYVATRNVADLAMRCTALAGYVHVSTA